MLLSTFRKSYNWIISEAIRTPEYRYRLLVVVLRGIQASAKWALTARGLEIGGPKGFGLGV